MADVTIVNPPPQVQSVAPAGGGQTQSPAPSTLPPGTVIAGIITGKDTSGNFLLRTAQGTIPLQSAAPLTYNSDVVIRIDAAGSSGTNTRIISVNGEPYASFSAPEAQTSDVVSSALLTPKASAPTATAEPVAVRAVVIATPASVATPYTPAGAASTQLTNGTGVVIYPSPQASAAPLPQAAATPLQPQETAVPANIAKLLQPQTPALPESNAPVSVPPPTANATAALPQPPEVIPTTQTPAATPSTPVTTTATSLPVAPAAAPPTSATPTAPAPDLPAQVISANTSGIVTLQTPIGIVTVKADALPATSFLTTGASVTLGLPGGTTPAVLLPQAAVFSVPATLTELAATWKTLADIVQTTATANPPVSQALLSRLPQLGPEFTSTSLAFINALVRGNTQKFLGDDVIDVLRQKGRLDLVDKFTNEVNTLSESVTQTPTRQISGWQTLFLPFVYQEELQQARLYVKRDGPKKDRSTTKNGGDTRFIVEVDLSELGPLQMDGLIQQKQQSTVFDLIIRSRNSLSKEEQAAIIGIYGEAGELTGFKGTVQFQVVYDFPVKPLEEVISGAAHSIIA